MRKLDKKATKRTVRAEVRSHSILNKYAADRRGAYIVGTPSGLANALLKLERGAKAYPMNASHTTAHLFIMNPLRGHGIAALFSTHPPVQERVKRLQNIKLFLEFANKGR